MPVAGGAPVLVCDVLNVAHGASWGTDGTILFSDQDGIHQVRERGGKPQLVASGFWPEALPRGAEGFVFTDFNEPSPKVWAHSWKTGQRHILIDGGSHARYAASGHLIYASNGSLFGVPFDTERLAITGAAIPVVKDVMMGLPQERDIAHFAISPAGTLAYLPGQRLGPGRTLAWVDHHGNEEPLPIEPQHYESPRLSPDGNRIAVEILEKPGGWNIWIYDRIQQFLKPLTSHPSHDKFPLWTRDGQRIIFNSTRDPGGWNLYSQAADGTGQPERLTLHSTKFGDGIPWIVTRDDKALIYSDGDDLQLLSMDGGRRSTPLLRGQTSQGRASLSPDGRWIAYASGETGTTRLHVRPFPDVESGRWEIPTSIYPSSIWARDGRELFYAGPDAMAVVPIETANAFVAGKTRDLFPFKGRYVLDTPRNFDISHDGQRFLMIKEAPGNAGALQPSARDELVVVFNCFEEFKRLAPRVSQ
jgi:serine/threonine-protein kinase